MNKLFVFSLGLSLSLSTAFSEGNGSAPEKEATTKKIISTFNVVSMHVSRDGMLNWTSTSENGSLTYFVEQYLFDRWVKVATIDGIGSSNANSYSCRVAFHNGENKFRVRQRGDDRISRYSDAVTHNYKTDEVTYQILNHNQMIEFSAETYYMIYDPYGDIVDQGYATTINISDYEKGRYCLIFDNKLDTFEKKKVILKNTAIAMAF